MSGEKFDGIVIGDESQYKIVLESYDKKDGFDKSFFKQVYSGAISNVKEIYESRINQSAQTTDSSVLNRFKSQKSINNLIGFMGERGTGKTSSMLSFAAALENEDYLKDNGIDKCISFTVMDIIDPTLINDNESIIQVIVATLFQETKNQLKGESGICAQQLLEKFERVYKSLKNISSDKVIDKIAEMDTLEALSELASSTNLRKELDELVNEYLVFKGKGKSDINFLVIPIDDMDLNISNTEKMIEEIRKYLMLPNIIILVAAKFEQLVDSMEKAYIKEYKDIIKDEPKKVPIQSMAIRYLEKLLPANRKNHMPNLMLED